MTKKLTKHGNSLALIIDKPLLDLLKIDEKTDLELMIEDGNLIIRPNKKKSRALRDKEIEKIAKRVIKEYEPVLKKLAKT